MYVTYNKYIGTDDIKKKRFVVKVHKKICRTSIKFNTRYSDDRKEVYGQFVLQKETRMN